VTSDFEREALIASGVTKEAWIHAYLRELDELLSQFELHVPTEGDPTPVAQHLFVWLWQKKPNRYKAGASFKLHHVIRAQRSKGREPVGNCLGLTLLYNSLLRRKNIDASAVYLDNAFGIGPHVLTALTTEKGVIDVENILSDGFDYKGHLKDVTRRSLGERELVAEIYNSAGNEFFRAGQFDKALKNYEMAIRLAPNHERAPLNILIVGDKIATEKGLRSK
jgi:tetratricopeptide (TPR) repeat protein